MGKAVGGAGAVGCGVLGFGGLIVGTGLTVWLGSQAMSGVGGDVGDAGDGKDLKSLTSEVSILSENPIVGEGPNGQGLTIAAPPELAEGETVTVDGVRFSPGPIEITTCLTNPVGATTADRCDATTTAVATVDSRGDFTLAYPARRVLTVGGTAYDCAARSQACSLVANVKDGPVDAETSAGLTFAGGLSPVDAAPPPEG